MLNDFDFGILVILAARVNFLESRLNQPLGCFTLTLTWPSSSSRHFKIHHSPVRSIEYIPTPQPLAACLLPRVAKCKRNDRLSILMSLRLLKFGVCESFDQMILIKFDIPGSAFND